MHWVVDGYCRQWRRVGWFHAINAREKVVWGCPVTSQDTGRTDAWRIYSNVWATKLPEVVGPRKIRDLK